MLTHADRIAIRKWYEPRMSIINAAPCGWGFDKYSFPWLDRLSPIEREAFDECITIGLVMYPEFPVGPYWVDLGNPRTKIAIECDGAAYHTSPEQRARDERRDRILLREYGWTVHRISGSTIRRRPQDRPQCECYELQDCECGYAEWLQGGSLEAVLERVWAESRRLQERASERPFRLTTTAEALEAFERRQANLGNDS
jgi:hypothetical protein